MDVAFFHSICDQINTYEPRKHISPPSPPPPPNTHTASSSSIKRHPHEQVFTLITFPWQVLFACVDREKWQAFTWQVCKAKWPWFQFYSLVLSKAIKLRLKRPAVFSSHQAENWRNLLKTPTNGPVRWFSEHSSETIMNRSCCSRDYSRSF